MLAVTFPMADAKTVPTGDDPAAYLAALTPERRRHDAQALDALFQEVTGVGPTLWNGGILGYGRYDYTYSSGRSGTSLATGFAPRGRALSIYVMPGYADFGEILSRLGKHKIGKSCLYVTKLADIDMTVLADLIRAGLADLAKKWPVRMV